MPLDEAYFVWLYSQVAPTSRLPRNKTYWKLLKVLHGKIFTWDEERCDMDGNRAHDGQDLRTTFVRKTGTVADLDGWMELPCSVLEMLVALAFKLAFDTDGDIQSWFWEMIDNLGLSKCNDAYRQFDDLIVNHIIDKFLNRDYGSNGSGGLFPLDPTKPHDDQRNVELWYQGQAYILERL